MTVYGEKIPHIDILLSNRMTFIFKNNVLEQQGEFQKMNIDHLADVARVGSFMFHNAHDYDYLGEAIEYMGGLPVGIAFDADTLTYGMDLVEKDDNFRDELCLDEED